VIRRRNAKRRVLERELQEAKLRTSASHLRAQREYKASSARLAESHRVALYLAAHSASLEQFGVPLAGTPRTR